MSRVRETNETHARMIAAAGRAFRRKGFGGVGVDGLAQEAELTSGAFYFHFRSKLGAFVESLRAGLDDLRNSIEQLQSEHGRDWLREFVAFYLGYKRTCELGDTCSLPILSSEVERAGKEAQAAYQEALQSTAQALERGLKDTLNFTSREEAWVLLALLSGGTNMARAVHSPEVSEEIAAAVAKGALLFGRPSRVRPRRRPS